MSDFEGEKTQLEIELKSKSSVNQNIDPKVLLTSALGALVWQLMIVAGLYVFAPAYFLPFFNNSGVRLGLVALLAWQLLGPWLIAQLPDERWKKVNRNIFSSAPLTIALIVGPALMTTLGDSNLADTSQSGGTSQTVDKATDANSQEIQFKDAVLKTSTMSIQIDRALITKSLSNYGADATASADATYLLVFHTFRNDGNSSLSLHPGSPYAPGLIVDVEDGTSFAADEDASDLVGDKEGLQRRFQLQPGLSKAAVVVFEIPVKQLKNNPCLFISHSTWAGKIPLFPDQNTKAAEATTSSSTEVASATGASPKPNQQNVSADDSTTSQPSKLETESEASQQIKKDSSVADKVTPANGGDADSPAAVVKQLYEIHLHSQDQIFDPKSRTILDKYFDQKLTDLIWKDLSQDKFDADPLTNAQNLENPDFKIGDSEISQNNATVKVNFFNFGKMEIIKFHLHNTGSSWKISNIDYANGTDLLKSLE